MEIIWLPKYTLTRAKKNQALNRTHFILRIRRLTFKEDFRTFNGEPLTYQNWAYGYPLNLTHGESLFITNFWQILSLIMDVQWYSYEIRWWRSVKKTNHCLYYQCNFNIESKWDKQSIDQWNSWRLNSEFKLKMNLECDQNKIYSTKYKSDHPGSMDRLRSIENRLDGWMSEWIVGFSILTVIVQFATRIETPKDRSSIVRE